MKFLLLAFLVGSVFSAPSSYNHLQKRSVGKLLEQLVQESGLHELLPWVQDKIKNDPDVEKVVDFFRSERWERIKDYLRNCDSYKEIKDELLKEDINLVQILDDIKNFVVSSTRITYYQTRALGDVLNDFLAELDLERIVAIVQEKVKSDPDMKKLVDFVKGDKLKNIVECMKSSPDVQDLVEDLRNEGIDVRKLIDLVKALFPITRYHHRQARSVGKLIDTLVTLTGLHELLPWVQDKLQNEPAMEKIVEFFESEKYDNIKDHLRNCKAFKEVEKELLAEELDVFKILDEIKNFVLGKSRQTRASLGDILNDFIGELDLERIVAIIQEKIKTDPDMKKLIDFIKTGKLKAIDSCMKTSQDVQDLLEDLRAEDIDVEQLVEMIKALFPGVRSYQARSVHSLLQELIKGSGLHDLLPWLQDAIRNDPDLQQVVDYFRSERWQNLKAEVKACPSYQAIKDKLEGQGIYVLEILESVKNFVTGDKRHGDRRDLSDLLNEVLSQLDLDNLIVLIHDKLQNDPDMKALVAFLEGDDIKSIAKCLRASPEAQYLLEKLKDQGIDVVRIVELLKVLFASDYYMSLSR